MGLNIIKSVRNTIIIHEDFAIPTRMNSTHFPFKSIHSQTLTGAEAISHTDTDTGTDASQILMILLIGAISSWVPQVCLAGA